jgi:hypothetical protein
MASKWLCNRIFPFKNWKNAIIKPFYFEKNGQSAIGERFLNAFGKFLLG